MIAEPLLPPGINVTVGMGLDERPAIHVDLGVLSLVLTPQETRTFALLLLKSEDRQVRTLGALLMRQASLCEEAEGYRGLQVVGGREA